MASVITDVACWSCGVRSGAGALAFSARASASTNARCVDSPAGSRAAALAASVVACASSSVICSRSAATSSGSSAASIWRSMSCSRLARRSSALSLRVCSRAVSALSRAARALSSALKSVSDFVLRHWSRACATALSASLTASSSGVLRRPPSVLVLLVTRGALPLRVARTCSRKARADLSSGVSGW